MLSDMVSRSMPVGNDPSLPPPSSLFLAFSHIEKIHICSLLYLKIGAGCLEKLMHSFLTTYAAHSAHVIFFSKLKGIYMRKECLAHFCCFKHCCFRVDSISSALIRMHGIVMGSNFTCNPCSSTVQLRIGCGKNNITRILGLPPSLSAPFLL